MRQPAEFLFSLNVLNLCCHLWRQWQTSNTRPHPQHPSLTDEAMWPCGGKHILKFTPHTHTFFGCPLLLQYNIASHSLCDSVSFVFSAGLINFYIRYTSLKMLHCFVLPLCVYVCRLFLSAKWLSCTNVARVRRKDFASTRIYAVFGYG